MLLTKIKNLEIQNQSLQLQLTENIKMKQDFEKSSIDFANKLAELQNENIEKEVQFNQQKEWIINNENQVNLKNLIIQNYVQTIETLSLQTRNQ